MSKVKLQVSRKTVIILLLFLFLILGGTGGYLLWRTNQEKTVAPTESEAGGGGLGCGPDGCNCDCNSGKCTCGCPGQVSCYASGKDCTTPCCVWPEVAWWLADQGEGNCACAPRTREYPRNTKLECHDTVPRCEPPACPTGYIDMYIPTPNNASPQFERANYSAEDLVLIDSAKLFHHNTKIICKENGTDPLCFMECTAKCDPCQNTYCVRRMCKKAPICGDGNVDPGEQCDPGPAGSNPVPCIDANGNESVCGSDCNCIEVLPNVCDAVGASGNIVLSPATPEYCEKVDFSYTAGDTDGVGQVTVTLDDVNIEFNETAVGHTKKITGTIPGDKNCNTSKHTLKISWVDVHGNSGGDCSQSITYTPKPAPAEVCDGKDKGGTIIFSGGTEVEGGKKYIYNVGDEVKYSYVMGDSKSVDYNSIQVLIGSTEVRFTDHPAPTFDPPRNNPTITVSGVLNPLPPARRLMRIFWKRVGETFYNGEVCSTEREFTINSCDALGAKWESRPSGDITENKDITFTYITGDSDGVDGSSILVLLNDTPVNFSKESGVGNTIKVSGNLSPTGKRLDQGTYTLKISWKDIYGAGGKEPCYISTTFKVVEELFPDWGIDKVSTEECIDDGTENPRAKIINTITVTNKGIVAGKLSKIVDTLDSKVDCSIVSDISAGGVCEGSVITWIFNPADEYAAGSSKSFSYSYIVSKDQFGIYDNTVIATTESNNELRAGSSIEARCNVVSPSCGDGNVDTGLGEQCDPPGTSCINAYGQESTCTNLCSCPGDAPVPKTGVFDNSENIVIIGAVILFTGLGWTWLSDTYTLVNGKLVQKRKEGFENRVVKR